MSKLQLFDVTFGIKNTVGVFYDDLKRSKFSSAQTANFNLNVLYLHECPLFDWSNPPAWYL